MLRTEVTFLPTGNLNGMADFRTIDICFEKGVLVNLMGFQPYYVHELCFLLLRRPALSVEGSYCCGYEHVYQALLEYLFF